MRVTQHRFGIGCQPAPSTFAKILHALLDEPNGRDTKCRSTEARARKTEARHQTPDSCVLWAGYMIVSSDDTART